MKISEILGSSHKIGSQRKFFNKKQFEFFKDGKSKGLMTLDWKMTEEELKNTLMEFMEMSGADTVVLKWTAQNGHTDEIVEL